MSTYYHEHLALSPYPSDSGGDDPLLLLDLSDFLMMDGLEDLLGPPEASAAPAPAQRDLRSQTITTDDVPTAGPTGLMGSRCEETSVAETLEQPIAQDGGVLPAVQTIGTTTIVFKVRTELDTLDDGFKWRKYGKKTVKGNPNMRNYYRCQSRGCGVKKRVQRDRDDAACLVITYEGAHVHPPVVQGR